MEMTRLTQDGTAKPVRETRFLCFERGQGNIHFPCLADHEQNWQRYPVDQCLAACDDDHTTTTYAKLRKQCPQSMHVYAFYVCVVKYIRISYYTLRIHFKFRNRVSTTFKSEILVPPSHRLVFLFMFLRKAHSEAHAEKQVQKHLFSFHFPLFGVP